MTDTTDIAALKINTYSVNSNDAWPQCADDDRTGSYVKWEDVVNLLSAQRKGNESETGFDSLKNLKFVADCCIENPDSIYASEFFLLLDEMFGKQGDYSMPVQAVAVSRLIGLLEAERQRADKAESERDSEWNYKRLLNTSHQKLLQSEALVKAQSEELAELRAKLANPVVLHSERFDYQETDEYEVGYVRGFNASRRESIADIKKAGFTVKGE
jgi:hypothetical protein